MDPNPGPERKPLFALLKFGQQDSHRFQVLKYLAKPDNPLSESRQAPDEAIRKFDFMRLRQLVHFVLRYERWSDGYESPILNAFASGLLPAIADKLRNDESLYLP